MLQPQPAIDSRLYDFAYPLRGAEDIPADFPPLPVSFTSGVFLPKEHPGRSAPSRYSARLLLSNRESISLVPHPATHKRAQEIRVTEITAVQHGRFLLHCWDTILTDGADYKIPFRGRDAKAVDGFFRTLRSQVAPLLLGCRPPQRLGGDPDLRITNAENGELEPDESLLLSFTSPGRQSVRRRLVFEVRERTAFHHLALTTRRMLWITNELKGRSQEYGWTTLEMPIRFARIEVEGTSLVVSAGRHAWRLLIDGSFIADAQGFVSKAQAALGAKK